jgi:hypothetical protein
VTQKVLIDTSAWIEFYHPKGSDKVKDVVKEALERVEIGVASPIITEVLSGASNEEMYKLLWEDLSTFTYLPLGLSGTEKASRISWKLARKGKRVPTVDLLIASAAIEHGYELWHYGDEHFNIIASSSSLVQRDLKD